MAHKYGKGSSGPSFKGGPSKGPKGKDPGAKYAKSSKSTAKMNKTNIYGGK